MVVIPLTRGKVALVDDWDAHQANYRWHAIHECWRWYAKRTVTRGGVTTWVRLHREVLRARPGIEIDHVNRDGLDCRRANLRVAMPGENQRNQRRRTDNTSGFIGVSWHKDSRAWVARIMRDGKQRVLGRFHDPVAAARAYDAAARELHGEFASVNFPVGTERAA
jgi:hypothetical protein